MVRKTLTTYTCGYATRTHWRHRLSPLRARGGWRSTPALVACSSSFSAARGERYRSPAVEVKKASRLRMIGDAVRWRSSGRVDGERDLPLHSFRKAKTGR